MHMLQVRGRDSCQCSGEAGLWSAARERLHFAKMRPRTWSELGLEAAGKPDRLFAPAAGQARVSRSFSRVRGFESR